MNFLTEVFALGVNYKGGAVMKNRKRRVVAMGLGLAMVLSGTSLSFAEEPKGSPTPSTDTVQERMVPMQRSGIMNVPRYQGPRTPLPPKGGTMNFSCGMTSCTCHGDVDCNNMFSSSVCGRSAVCDTSSGVECSCLRAQ
jgi:hypothetical protein